MQPLDLYDDLPRDMRRYLRHYGWNFNKRACEYASSELRLKNPATNKIERLSPWTKEQVDEMLKREGVTIEHNKGYNYVYIANVAKAKFLRSSLSDEKHLALHIKDEIDDMNMPGGNTFRRWYSDQVRKGEVIDWESFMDD